MNSGNSPSALEASPLFGKRSIVFLLAAILLLTLSSSLPAQRREPIPRTATIPAQQPQAKPAIMKMRVEEGRLIADITDTPLQNVLRELAERTGIIFEVRSQDNPLVSIHLQRVTLQEGIQRIASGSNAIFFYGEGSGSERIILVRVLPRTPIPQPSLVYLGTGVVTKTNYTVETPEQALQVLSSNASVEDREVGIEILVKTKGDPAVKALMNCLSDPAPEIRVAAIEGLASMDARAALPAILKGLKDSHPGVRQSATNAVALIGDARNVKDLKPLSFDKDSSVAAAAEIAIRKLSAAERK